MRRPGRFQARLMRGWIGREVLAPNYRFRVQKWQVQTPFWQDRPMLRIGILSDLHWGYRPMSPRLLEAVKRRLSALSPDLIVFLGDLSEGRNAVEKVRNGKHGAAQLSGLAAPLGCYAVLGNHDWHDDAIAQSRRSGPVAAVEHLQAAGFKVLQNHSVRPAGQGFWLSGLDSQQAFKGGQGEARRLGAHDLAATLEQAPGKDPIILLAHEPDIFPELDEPRVVLTLSGHMHAGQIRPFGKALYAPSRYGTRFAYGRFENGSKTLIVSGGLGCSTIPLRIGIVPELTVVEISGR